MFARLLFNACCRFRRILCDFIWDTLLMCVSFVCSNLFALQLLYLYLFLFVFYLPSPSAACKSKKINNQVSGDTSLIVVQKHVYAIINERMSEKWCNLERWQPVIFGQLRTPGQDAEVLVSWRKRIIPILIRFSLINFCCCCSAAKTWLFDLHSAIITDYWKFCLN